MIVLMAVCISGAAFSAGVLLGMHIESMNYRETLQGLISDSQDLEKDTYEMLMDLSGKLERSGNADRG